MVDTGLTEMEFPVDTKVEAQPPVYQYTTPTAPFAVKEVDDPLQMVFAAAVIDVGVGGGGDMQLSPMLKELLDEYP